MAFWVPVHDRGGIAVWFAFGHKINDFLSFLSHPDLYLYLYPCDYR